MKNKILLIILVGIFFSILFFLNFYFQISELKITKLKNNIVGLSELKYKNILFFNIKKETESLLNKNVFLKNIKIKKNYPNSLSIEAEEEVELANLIVFDGFYILGSDSKIISKSKNQNLNFPKINFYQKINYSTYSLGDKVDISDIKKTLIILDKLKKIISVNFEINILSDGTIEFVSKEKKFLFSASKDLDIQMEEFKIIYQRFKIENKEYYSIDLRFDKPIIGISKT